MHASFQISLFIFVYFLKLYFIDYAITVVPIFLPLPPSTLHYLRQSQFSRPWAIHVSSLAPPFPILSFTSPWLFCTYLFILLNPLTSSSILPHPSRPATIKMFSLSMILSLFVLFVQCFLNSITDRYVFIATLLFIVLIFFLNKSL